MLRGGINLILDNNLKEFVKKCNSISTNPKDNQNDGDDLFNNINSKYYSMFEFNRIKNNLSSDGYLSYKHCFLGKHIDELKLTLSLLKNEFQIIVITEHKMRRGVVTTVNIDIPGYKPFIFDYTETRHGGTWFYVKDSFQIKVRDDLKFNSPGNFESTFIELIFPNTKFFIVGCIYRHLSSSVSLNHFTSDYIEPSLDKISLEGKM